MEHGGMIECAQRAHVNLVRRHARARELVAIGAPQVEMRLLSP